MGEFILIETFVISHCMLMNCDMSLSIAYKTLRLGGLRRSQEIS
jgi:hypothetical protein